MLSVLQQMLQSDKGDGVRQAVVKSLGILVSFIDDKQKFKQVRTSLLNHHIVAICHESMIHHDILPTY